MVRDRKELTSSGDRAVAVWRAFYDRSFHEAAGYAMRLTGGKSSAAEDLVHDAYLAMVRAWQNGRIDEMETGWLIVTIRHLFLNKLRDEGREERRLRLVHSASAPIDEPTVSSVDELLQDLPDRHRAALILRYVDDLSVGEVAANLGLSLHATESLLARARDQVRRRRGEQRHG